MARPISSTAAVSGAALFAAADLAIKALIAARLPYGQQIELLPTLNIVHVVNHGAAFGFLATAGGWQRYLFIAIALFATGLIIQMIRKPATTAMERVGLAMILGGAVGNLIDRTARMGVVDWIDVHAGGHHWPAFNIADIGISVGAAVIVFYMLFASRAAEAVPERAP